MELKHYETTFIIPPIVEEAAQQEIIDKYIKLLQAQEDLKILHETKPTFRKLAYPIQKQENGIYKTIEFTAAPGFIQELELQYKRDERILRFLTVCLSEKAAQYQKDQRELPDPETDHSTTE